MRSKESGKVRYAYGVAMALLIGGTAFSLATGQAGAQVAQNAPGTEALAPRPGAPMSFADLVAKLQPGGKVREAHRRAWTRRQRRRRVLGDLRAGLPGGERKCGSPEKQGHGDPIGVAHLSGLLRLHRYSIIWLAWQVVH